MNIFNQEELIDFEFPYKLWNSPPLCSDYPACPHNCKGVYGHMVAFCPQNSTARTTLRDSFSYSGSKIDMPLKPDMSEPVVMLSGFEEVDHITYCSAIPISSGLSQFCLKIPYPNQHVNQDKKNPDFHISSDIFLLMISDRNCPLKTLEWDFRASTFQNFTGEHSPDLPGGPCLQRLHDLLVIKNYRDFTSSHGWTV